MKRSLLAGLGRRRLHGDARPRANGPGRSPEHGRRRRRHRQHGARRLRALSRLSAARRLRPPRLSLSLRLLSPEPRRRGCRRRRSRADRRDRQRCGRELLLRRLVLRRLLSGRLRLRVWLPVLRLCLSGLQLWLRLPVRRLRAVWRRPVPQRRLALVASKSRDIRRRALAGARRSHLPDRSSAVVVAISPAMLIGGRPMKP
jgi:hypothetical protein